MYSIRKHAYGIILEVTVKVARFPNLNGLNKGKDIVFECFLRNDYPFSSPQIFCSTEVPLSLVSFLCLGSTTEETSFPI